MGQPVAFFEVVSPHHERAQRFYADLFRWSVNGAGEQAITGGIGPDERPGDAGVRIHVRVDDMEAYLRRAEQLDGKRLTEPTDLPDGVGRIALFTDPAGNHVGLWA